MFIPPECRCEPYFQAGSSHSTCCLSHMITCSVMNTSTRWLTQQISGETERRFCQTVTRATGKYTQDNNLHLFLSLLPPTLPSPFISNLCLGVAINPPTPTSPCVVVATPRPPHCNACVFVSGVAALPLLVSPFFCLCPFEIENKKGGPTDRGKEMERKSSR